MSGATRHTRDAREGGAALLVVLLLVAVMSVVAVGASDAVRHAARRAANVETRSQATWYLMGAEELARATLKRSAELDPDRTTLRQPWAVGPTRFEVDGGLIEGLISDASNCFNLNSLAGEQEGRVGGYQIDAAAMARMRALLDALDIDAASAQSLVAGAADWIDADSRARGYGAEDYDYGFADPPYRAANGLFAEVDELRGVSGVSEGVFRAVRPYLCARASTDPSTINLNTLEPRQAPLLTMLYDGRLAVDAARDVISARPEDGWASAEEFFALEAVARYAVENSVKEQFGVRASYFELYARVRAHDAYVESHTLFRLGGGGAVSLIRRRMGADA